MTSSEKLIQWIKKFQKEHIKCTICVDSNIGGGKSTLLELLSKKEELKDYIELLFEPVERWQDINGSNLLHLFYNDPQKYSYIFQTMTIITRMESHDKADKNKLIIGERSWLTDKNVFVKQLHSDNLLSDFEYDCYNEWYNYWTSKAHIDGILYIDTKPEECYRRKHNLRQRKEEESIPLSYLQNLDKRHHEWLDNSEELEVHHIDGSVNFIVEYDELDNIVFNIAKLLEKIYKKKSTK
jgi:deoxyadenosine/deoxycytidine kinase